METVEDKESIEIQIENDAEEESNDYYETIGIHSYSFELFQITHTFYIQLR